MKLSPTRACPSGRGSWPVDPCPDRAWPRAPCRGPCRRIGLEVEDFGLEQDLLEQGLDAGALLGGDLGGERLSAELLEHDVVLQQVLLDFLHGWPSGRSILLMATMIGTPASLAWLMASLVCGMTSSSAATTSTTMSVTFAPRARMAVNASWPGVSTKVIAGCPARDVIGADVLGDAARLARDDVRLPDVVEQRRLAVVDVAHDRDDRRPRHQLSGVSSTCSVSSSAAYSSSRTASNPNADGDQLDLVEVEPLVHRHHQPQLLEGELDDLGSGHLHGGGELGHRDEFVDPDSRLLPLLLFRRRPA